MLRQYERKHEAHYEVTKYICEFWNTISNLVFVVIGIIRLSSLENNSDLVVLYSLFIGAGIGSGIHHACEYQYSIVIDLIPILVSIIYVLIHNYVLEFITFVSWLKFIIAISVLIADHGGVRCKTY